MTLFNVLGATLPAVIISALVYYVLTKYYVTKYDYGDYSYSQKNLGGVLNEKK